MLVSVIIVNWNGRHLIDRCLNSLYDQTYKGYEIIVVDNGSEDGSPSFITEKHPSVKLIGLSENRGFTGGNIEGYRQARGDYIALVNNDAVLSERWLELMIESISSDDRIGLCSSKIIIAGTNRIDSAGDIFTTAFTGTKIGENEDAGRFTERRMIPGACAAAVLYRRSMLDEIGFLDDDFFLNHEDTDLNMRAWLAGWKCLFVPDAVVYHKVSASIGSLSNTAVYYFARNNEWVWLKNVPLKLLIKSLPQRVVYECASFGYFCFIAKKWRPFLKGKLDAVLGFNMMMRKRRTIQRLVRLSEDEICRDLMPISEYLKIRMTSLREK